MDFQEAVARRRVRDFAPDPIDRPVLVRIAMTAQRAPSAGFSQGQRLVVPCVVNIEQVFWRPRQESALRVPTRDLG